MSPCSLQKSIERANQLAYCDSVIRGLMRDLEISPADKRWACDMFQMSEEGTIAWFLFGQNNAQLERLLPLSRKLDDYADPSPEDWKMMLDGIQEYRSHLIRQGSKCNCE